MEPTTASTTSQPRAAMQMSAMNPAPANNTQTHEEHQAKRLRGGGAGKDCLIGLLGCFLCFECCKVTDGEHDNIEVYLIVAFYFRTAVNASRTSFAVPVRCAVKCLPTFGALYVPTLRQPAYTIILPFTTEFLII
ncbi:hypothetical protein M405DRAFT_867956 [Rhizopogon salebrosus TDB-379]|nr:hypothetical protein M405DRAFT_867956 [Rhizopogon salebrosus TDB-379]